jgi:hypothetical protein
VKAVSASNATSTPTILTSRFFILVQLSSANLRIIIQKNNTKHDKQTEYLENPKKHRSFVEK